MKILGHRHTGIIVQNLDKMLEFYIGLGLELRIRNVERGPFIYHLLNNKNIVLETAKLILNDESVSIKHRFQLELMMIKANKSNVKKSLLEKILSKFDLNNQPLGILDIAFTVDDIKAVIEYIDSNGGDIISKPMEAAVGFPALHSYARDPEGNVLHLAQNLTA